MRSSVLLLGLRGSWRLRTPAAFAALCPECAEICTLNCRKTRFGTMEQFECAEICTLGATKQIWQPAFPSWQPFCRRSAISLLVRNPCKPVCCPHRNEERVMGSTGYLTCGICWMCGKCYPRKTMCPQCGETIDLDKERCQQCGRVIGDADRLQARERFKAVKKAEAERAFSGGRVRSAAVPNVPIPTSTRP